MKKMILAIITMLAFSHTVKALDLTDQIKLTLLDHVTMSTQFGDGEKKTALLDSVVLIGSHNGRSVFDIQGGLAGNIRPDPDETGINWLVNGYFKVSTLLRDKIHFADHWRFLNALEYGVSYSYNLTDKRDYVSVQAGLAFGLAPQ